MREDITEDPMVTFDRWLREHGFLDVVACKPEDVNLDRLHEAIELYGQDGEGRGFF